MEARGQLKIKTYELDRVSLQHAEAMTNIRSSKMEIDALQKKVELLKQEYYKVIDCVRCHWITVFLGHSTLFYHTT